MAQCFHGTVNVLLISYFSRETDKSEPIIHCGYSRAQTLRAWMSRGWKQPSWFSGAWLAQLWGRWWCRVCSAVHFLPSVCVAFEVNMHNTKGRGHFWAANSEKRGESSAWHVVLNVLCTLSNERVAAVLRLAFGLVTYSHLVRKMRWMSKSEKMAGSWKVRRGMDIRNEVGDKMNQAGNAMEWMIDGKNICWILGAVLFLWSSVPRKGAWFYNLYCCFITNK